MQDLQKDNQKEATEVTVPNNFLIKLKVKWGLESMLQVVLILIVFTLTGSTVVYLRKALFLALGFDADTDFWIKAVSYLVFVFPAYQILLLVYGFLLGQFSFFWEKEKKMVRAIGRLFKK
ncbi:MAG: hypothetical protein LAT68_10310 [Cyclobacteriaceae bacterium]|nr:hypothetical protein [Cyclobacteriaceae bacterium]MCH8516707.1 hypothetical protein [Cyclobacteriaceae bacterium]